MTDAEVRVLSQETIARLRKFDELRGKKSDSGVFWDIVVITAVDEAQKDVYELELKNKLEANHLPLSATYVVVNDPPGYKIGNGGSTLVVIDHLHRIYQESLWEKKILIIHAGGFSQRMPNASLLGKAFTAIPVGNPMYQALEIKLASYIDFPGKISGGGIFVCCADSIEVYNDRGLPWEFSTEGFTALAHSSSILIGTTHGVFVLDSPLESTDIFWSCKKFLHKPTEKLMRSTENCVSKGNHGEEWVFTDSAFFISTPVNKKLLEFYKNNKPLTCEIDAYGDFLQALGTNSSADHVSNMKNVYHKTSSLLQLREKVYDLLQNTPLQAVVLAPTENNFDAKIENPITSIFYHMGTLPEYKDNFTSDEGFRRILGVNPLSSCKGIPHKFSNGVKNTGKENSLVQVNKHGAMTCHIRHTSIKTPCIMGSVLQSQVSVCEGTIIEYSHLQGSVTVGENCIISNCKIPAGSHILDNTFMHTTSVKIEDRTGFVTVIFSNADNLKESLPSSECGSLKYFGVQLKNLYSAISGDPSLTTLSLWTVKLFPFCTTTQESCAKACEALNKINASGQDNLYDGCGELYSMMDVLQYKNVQSMLDFRMQLAKEIQDVSQSSHLNEIKTWVNEI